MLAAFGQDLRDDAYADLARLSERLRAVVEDTMQPATMSLWLRPGPGLEQEHRR
jgi:hypothetical protein